MQRSRDADISYGDVLLAELRKARDTLDSAARVAARLAEKKRSKAVAALQAGYSCSEIAALSYAEVMHNTTGGYFHTASSALLGIITAVEQHRSLAIDVRYAVQTAAEAAESAAVAAMASLGIESLIGHRLTVVEQLFAAAAKDAYVASILRAAIKAADDKAGPAPRGRGSRQIHIQA